MATNAAEVLPIFGEPDRETSLRAISRALLKVCSDRGIKPKRLAEQLGCSRDTINQAIDGEHMIGFETIARFGYHFPEEFKIVAQLWDCAVSTTPTVDDRIKVIEGHLDAIRREFS